MKRHEYGGWGRGSTGSVLGPTLRNMMHDNIMDALMPEGTEIVLFLVCYADDAAVLVSGKTREEMLYNGNEALKSAWDWMERNELQMAPEKTVAMVVGHGKKMGDRHFQLELWAQVQN